MVTSDITSSLTTSLQRFTCTTTSTVAQGARTIGVNVNHTGTSGTDANNFFQVERAQLEIGDIATDFEHRSYGEELALCQRYYYQIGPHSSSQRFGIDGLYSNGTGAGLNIQFPHPTTMRAAPTLTAGAGFSGTTAFPNTEQYIYMTTTNHAAGRVSCEISSGTTTLDAEL